jgi:hypothetical protein
MVDLSCSCTVRTVRYFERILSFRCVNHSPKSDVRSVMGWKHFERIVDITLLSTVYVLLICEVTQSSICIFTVLPSPCFCWVRLSAFNVPLLFQRVIASIAFPSSPTRKLSSSRSHCDRNWWRCNHASQELCGDSSRRSQSLGSINCRCHQHGHC